MLQYLAMLKCRPKLVSALVWTMLVVSGLQGAPMFDQDSVAINTSEPNVGAPVLALAGSQWIVGFEDLWRLPSSSDDDFNDYAVRVIVDSGGLFSALHFGGASAHQHEHTAYEAAGEVIVRLADLTSGAVWFSGDASRNADGSAHAYVECIQGCGNPDPSTIHTPEPSTGALTGLCLCILLGLGGIARVCVAREVERPSRLV